MWRTRAFIALGSDRCFQALKSIEGEPEKGGGGEGEEEKCFCFHGVFPCFLNPQSVYPILGKEQIQKAFSLLEMVSMRESLRYATIMTKKIPMLIVTRNRLGSLFFIRSPS